jgi:hypothetical protein
LKSTKTEFHHQSHQNFVLVLQIVLEAFAEQELLIEVPAE